MFGSQGDDEYGKETAQELYDYFYVRPELDEQENEVEECHKALIEALAKPERKLVLRIIDAQNLIIEQTSPRQFYCRL